MRNYNRKGKATRSAGLLGGNEIGKPIKTVYHSGLIYSKA